MSVVIQQPLRPSSTDFGSRGGKRSIKMVSCIIRSEKLILVTDSINKLNLVGGMTVTDVRGMGREEPFRGAKYEMSFVPKVKIEIAIESSDVNEVGALVSELARTGEVGDGKIFIGDVIDVMRIRTGERGVSAL